MRFIVCSWRRKVLFIYRTVVFTRFHEINLFLLVNISFFNITLVDMEFYLELYSLRF